MRTTRAHTYTYTHTTSPRQQAALLELIWRGGHDAQQSKSNHSASRKCYYKYRAREEKNNAD